MAGPALPAILSLAALSGAAALPGGGVTVRVLDGGRPITGASCYPMPGGSPQGCTDADGIARIRWSLIDTPREVEICVVLPDGRRTEFGECVVRPGWLAGAAVDIELAGRRSWLR